MSKRARQLVAAAVALTVPWVLLWGATSLLPRLGLSPPAFFPNSLVGVSTLVIVTVTGVAVLGAAFLLAWAAETAEKDVPRSFAIAVLAILAVAPEYAVDALYAWDAGAFFGTPRGIEAGNLAVANMTGANRILIGIGWAGIAIFTVYRHGAKNTDAVEDRPGLFADVVHIDRGLNLEIFFLLLATLWAFLIPVKGGIDIFDMLVLVGIYFAYIAVILRGGIDPPTEHVGVPLYLQTFAKRWRVSIVILLFAYSGALILTAVEPFAHGLETIGHDIGVPSFFMIQWIAPLASEAPELIVVLYLVNKARATAGFNTLISSKLNQWTLLIGTLVIVYSLALGRYGVLSFDSKQAAEIWLTAAQSLFAIAVLLNFRISVREALVLLGLFCSQVFLEFLLIRGAIDIGITSEESLYVFTGIYLVLAAVLFVTRRRSLIRMLRSTVGVITAAISPNRDPSLSEHR